MRMMLMAMLLAAFGGTVGQAADNGLMACGANQVQALLGQPVADVQGELPETARIIPPDSVVTQDFSPTRMNVDLDAAGDIVRIWCG